jgi:isopentenyl-diphosphate delta-isomerase
VTATEYVVLVDENDQDIGVEEKLSAHEKNLLHRAFSIFIFRKVPRLEILLQQRALSKYHSPGLWTNSCCGHPRPGESVLDAGVRRLREEFGFSATLKEKGIFHYNAHFPNGLSENEIDHVLVGEVPENILLHPHPDEIHAFRWVTIEELREEIQTKPMHFTPWLEQALNLV